MVRFNNYLRLQLLSITAYIKAQLDLTAINSSMVRFNNYLRLQLLSITAYIKAQLDLTAINSYSLYKSTIGY